MLAVASSANVLVHLEYWKWFVNFDSRYIMSVIGQTFLFILANCAILRLVSPDSLDLIRLVDDVS